MITVEKLTPAWRHAFLVSRNSLFTPISADYFDRVENPASPFPARTFIGRNGSKVVSWGSFYPRKLELGPARAPGLKIAMACAIGTLPDHQRQGLGAKVWRAAEESLSKEIDGILVYTGEAGPGYRFYRAMGYLPLVYPRALRLTVTGESRGGPDMPMTSTFAESRDHLRQRGEVFDNCYRGYAGFMGDRPVSLNAWADSSFFYDEISLGCVPQISWLEDVTTGRWIAYAIWAGPIQKVDWKKGIVEIWELSCADDFPVEFLRRLLQPVRAAAGGGNGHVDWWAVDGHSLTDKMLALGFVERPRSLCALGKMFDPSQKLKELLRAKAEPWRSTEGIRSAGGRVDLHVDDGDVEIEPDAATRMIFGRSTATEELHHGLVTIRPYQRMRAMSEGLDSVLPSVPWSYFASEFI